MLDDLKAAMAAETADLVIAPDLAERVEHRARRQRWRTCLAALLIPLLAAAGWYLAPQLSSAPSERMVDGVEVGYLPPGLTREPDRVEKEGQVTTTVGRWTRLIERNNLQTGVVVGVQRGPLAITDTWRGDSRAEELEAVVAGRQGMRLKTVEVDYFHWAPEPDLVITVAVMGEVRLETVVAGIDY